MANMATVVPPVALGRDISERSVSPGKKLSDAIFSTPFFCFPQQNNNERLCACV